MTGSRTLLARALVYLSAVRRASSSSANVAHSSSSSSSSTLAHLFSRLLAAAAVATGAAASGVVLAHAEQPGPAAPSPPATADEQDFKHPSADLRTYGKSPMTDRQPGGKVPLPTDKLKCSWSRGAPGGGLRPVVLVACGSFNPPTYAHLRMMELARQELRERGHDVLGAYLSPVNDCYGKQELAPGDLRERMCQLAVEDSDLIMVDSWEVKQRQYSRTLTVLQHVGSRLNAMFADARGDENEVQAAPRVMLVCGADVLCTMADASVWQQDLLELQTLLQQHGVVCISRDGEGVDAAAVLRRPGTLLHRYQQNVVLVREPIPNDVRSSLVRRELERRRTAKYLVPEAVLQYIAEQRLYGPSAP